MYVANAGPPGGLRYQPSMSRPRPPRYAELGYPEQQQRQQYEHFEQQARYHRDASPSTANVQDQPQPQPQSPRSADAYGAPYRHSTYQGVYAGQHPPRPPPNPRQQQIQQLQTQRSLNLGQLGPNRFSVTSRDQLPTAPSPSVFSATQPEPKYPEARGPSPKPAEETAATGSTVHPSISTDSLVLSESGTATGSSHEPYRRVNRGSIYSTYSMGSPVTAERIPRPMSTMVEPSSRFPVSPNNIHSAIGSSHNSLARSGSDPHWSTVNPGLGGGNSVLSQAKARAAQSNACYSHQVTLSSIPVNEEVPPMPGKMTSKTGKVRIQLTFDRPFFNAGGELSGRLEIQCSSSRSVMLADMIVELLGYEALAKDHLAPKIFHKTVLRLQDIRHPSQAVQENIEPDAEGYWMARKGRTIFPFRLSIQDSLPNSYDSKLGQVRYVVSAIALMKANQSKEVVNHTRECFIYETWTTDDITQARRRSVKADTSKRLFMGGDGSLELYAELTRTMVSSGGIVYVNVGVKNLTKKKIMGIKLSLWRHIGASHSRSSFNSHSSAMSSRDQDNVKNYSEIIYKGEDYAFDSDDPRIVVLPVYIPSGVYSLRYTAYLHVQFFVQVSLMTSMSKALAVELPIYITHASSWSDPPPRIPRDFTFPMHEDEPVKKNKTGVFSKMKTNSGASSNGYMNGSGPKKSSGLTGSSSNLSSLASAASSKPATPNASSEVTTLESGRLHPSTRRSTLKDPDSPTSVLDFSQAGNLFVVNPDAASITTSSDSGSVVKQPLVTRLPPPPISKCILESRPSSPERPPSPLDRSTPLMLIDTLSPKTTEEARMEHTSREDEVQYFDKSRATSTSQTCSLIKRNSNKSDKSSKSGKMGLRKTLAKLSIAIPTHNSSTHHPGTTNGSKVSPRVLPSTPRSSKSLNLTSSEEMGSPRSDRGGRSLSRNSSGSSLGSSTHTFERHSCKSSTGSTRVVNISPGSGSTDNGSLPLSKMSSSSNGSAPQSDTTSVNPSRSSSPALPSASSSVADSSEDSNMRERHHEIDQLTMTPAISDVRLHHGTPVMEEMGREGYFEANDDLRQQSRPVTPSASESQVMTVQSSPATPNSANRPWDTPRNFSTTSLASSAPSEGGQSAQEIRDEYYYGRSRISRNMSIESLETRIAPPQVGMHAETGGDEIYTMSGETFDESEVPAAVQGHTNGYQSRSEIYGSVAQHHIPTTDVVGDRHLVEHHVVQDATSHQQQQLQQEQFQDLEYQQQQQQHQQDLRHQPDLHKHQARQPEQQQQQSWISERYDEPTTVPVIVQPLEDHMLNQYPVMEGYASIPPPAQHSPVRMNEVPAGLILPLIQSPEAYFGGEDYVRPLQARTLSHHSSRPHSRTSSIHSIVGQGPVDSSGVSTPRSAISLQQMENLSRSSSPMVRDPILRNTSMDNVVTFAARSNSAGISPHTYQPQQLPIGLDQHSTLLGDGQYAPEIYSKPMSSLNELAMESNNNINSGGLAGTYSLSTANGLSQPTTPLSLSTSNSFQSDNLRLTPNELGVNMQLGGGGMREQQQQFHPQASSATGYSGTPKYRESKYSAALQLNVYSPHPSRSNSRQVSPKQGHAEALLPVHNTTIVPLQRQQQSIEAMPGQVVVSRQPSLDPMTIQKQDNEHFIVVDASKPPGVAYQAVVDYHTAEMQATTPALTDAEQTHFESYPLQHSVYKDETRQVPYQPRTQYMPTATSVVTSDSTPPSHLESNARSPPTLEVTGGGDAFASPNYRQLTQAVSAALGSASVSLTTVVSPPPIPGRPWSQAPPVTFGGVPASMSVMDHQAGLPLSNSAPYPSQSSYVGMVEQVPTGQRSLEDAAAVTMALRAHQETVDRQGELSRQQEELARQQEVLALQEAIVRQEAVALAQQQQEALVRQNTIAQQEALAMQEAILGLCEDYRIRMSREEEEELIG
ncbi:hypothetical protein BGZ96_001077 [Linnemannia gamsii]|uniref:Arrestin C-terminal-like domain-containing protein n=1 Tax=Linnemannia gamsii TaxID=64522 RepID=A0ABQ7KC03_9FUNG|nr:hypothetical protein BGZ96_001077 [Linnemannia gamsii]